MLRSLEGASLSEAKERMSTRLPAITMQVVSNKEELVDLVIAVSSRDHFLAMCKKQKMTSVDVLVARVRMWLPFCWKLTARTDEAAPLSMYDAAGYIVETIECWRQSRH